jgi:hypothetical protein
MRETESYTKFNLTPSLKILDSSSNLQQVRIISLIPLDEDQDIAVEKSNEEKCIDIIKNFIPDLTVENVDRLGMILQKEGVNSKDGKFNAIMRKYHRLRYKP